MGFNPLVYARLAEKAISKQNPIKTAINTVLYTLLTFVNLPYKMKLLDDRIQEYQSRLNKYEKIINETPEQTKKGNKFNTLR
jgi:vacuolar-type H+-ATPase subunit D/Vma8